MTSNPKDYRRITGFDGERVYVDHKVCDVRTGKTWNGKTVFRRVVGVRHGWGIWLCAIPAGGGKEARFSLEAVQMDDEHFTPKVLKEFPYYSMYGEYPLGVRPLDVRGSQIVDDGGVTLWTGTCWETVPWPEREAEPERGK